MIVVDELDFFRAKQDRKGRSSSAFVVVKRDITCFVRRDPQSRHGNV